ncbi:MAG: ATP-binding protein [Phycisphaerae bacterium]|nr:ATP-binding protein [Phycisphaerae bacterium]
MVENHNFLEEDLIDRKHKNIEAIFDAIPIGLLLIDETLTISRVNNAIHKLLKKDYSEIINKNIGEVFNCSTTTTERTKCGFGHKCRNCPLIKNIKKVFKTSQSVHEFEFQSDTYFFGNPTKLCFLMNIEPVIIEDKRYAVVCLDDITEKKFAAEKLIETMELKTQFVSTVSHELRTPLTAIKEGINIVLDGMAGRVKKKQKKFLELAKRNVDRLSMLINDVLDFQKLESGRMKFDPALNNVSQIVREAADTMKLFADKHKVKLSVSLAADIGEAMLDRNHIIQVLTNLLSNAIKFTPEKGKVLLEAVRQNDEIVITVSDTGMGMPKDDLPKIFERFYRVRRPGKEIAGTGLGLPIVAQIINQHSGRIIVDSKLNKGTTFTVYLPVSPEKNEPDISVDQTIENAFIG